MSEINRLLKVREKLKNTRPKFRRFESWRYKTINSSWRRSRGIDSKVRRKKKGRITSPNIGYRTPKKVRNLHPSGFKEVVVHNITELERTDPRKQVIKIAHSIGRHKRIMIQDRADELNILVLNRTRILLPGEELLMEGRGIERELETFGEKKSFEEEEKEEISEDEESFDEDTDE